MIFEKLSFLTVEIKFIGVAGNYSSEGRKAGGHKPHIFPFMLHFNIISHILY